MSSLIEGRLTGNSKYSFGPCSTTDVNHQPLSKGFVCNVEVCCPLSGVSQVYCSGVENIIATQGRGIFQCSVHVFK